MLEVCWQPIKERKETMITNANKYGMMRLAMGCAVMSMTSYAQFIVPVSPYAGE